MSPLRMNTKRPHGSTAKPSSLILLTRSSYEVLDAALVFPSSGNISLMALKVVLFLLIRYNVSSI